MGQRMAPTRGTRRAGYHRMEVDQAFPWSGQSWTFSAVGRVWPGSEKILPESALLALSQAQQHRIIELFENHEEQAHECFRWARWMTEAGKLYVSCIRCQRQAWSYGAVTKWDRRQKRYCPVVGTWRWRCLTDRAHRANLDSKKRGPACTVRKGCGAQFYDTAATPLVHARFSLGLVFASAYFEPDSVERLLLKCDERTKATKLRELVKQLQKDQVLWKRLQRYARVFCGQILLQACPNSAVRMAGRKWVERNWEREMARQRQLACAQQNAQQRLREKYHDVETVLRQLKQVDLSRFRGHALDVRRRRDIVRQLIVAAKHVAQAGLERDRLAA